jgi:hypothetical protein
MQSNSLGIKEVLNLPLQRLLYDRNRRLNPNYIAKLVIY